MLSMFRRTAAPQAPVRKETPIHPDTKEVIDVVQEIGRCAQDPKYFINTYTFTKSTKLGVVRFRLYPFQNTTVDEFTKHRFNVILKGRQMGISWLCAAYIAWYVCFSSAKPKDVLVLANKQKQATKMVDKVKFIIGRLPKWMKEALNVERFTIDNRESIHLFNGSKVEASATTPDAARGDTLSLLVVDEAAFIRSAEETYTSLEPTLEVGGNCIVLSTPKGVGNWFHTLFIEAEAEINGYNPIVLGWEQHPDRDDAWAIKKTRQRGERLFGREYACRFDKSGNTLIHPNKLDLIEQRWIQPPADKATGDNEGLWTWIEPIPGHRYIVAADTAGGDDDEVDGEDGLISKTDFSAAVVIDIDTFQICATYYAKIRPGPYAKVLYPLCNKYNQALFVYDATGGWSGPLFDRFTEWNYQYIYHQPKNTHRHAIVNLFDERNKAGFTISSANRGTIIALVEELIAQKEGDDEPLFFDKRILNELKTFIRSKKDRHEAAQGKHDDLVMAMAIGYYVRQQWMLFHSGGSSLASMTLGSLRTGRQMRTTPHRPGDNYTPVTVRSYQNKLGNAFIDPASGEDLRLYMGEKRNKDGSEPQRSIFDNPF